MNLPLYIYVPIFAITILYRSNFVRESKIIHSRIRKGSKTPTHSSVMSERNTIHLPENEKKKK